MIILCGVYRPCNCSSTITDNIKYILCIVHFKIIMSCFRVLPSARAEAHARQNRRTPKGNFRCTTNFRLAGFCHLFLCLVGLVGGPGVPGSISNSRTVGWTKLDTQKGLQQPDKCGNPIPPWVNFCFHNFKIKKKKSSLKF